MTEQLLQFIWRFQYFNGNELQAVDGTKLAVIGPGLLNRDQGPDFSGSTIMIDSLRLHGQVELHVRTGDWLKHRHAADPNYGNVILHVVWQHDVPVNAIPVLELCHRVPRQLLGRYGQLMLNENLIPCNGNISLLGALGWTGWKDRLLFERVERKCRRVKLYLEKNGSEQESGWWLLAQSFGNRVNAEAFEDLAKSIPLRAIARNRHSRMRLEALLLGQAGLLEDPPADAYHSILLAEYRIQQQRFALVAPRIRIFFLRMRPGNFPGLRLAQLAALLFAVPDLPDLVRKTSSLKEMENLLRVELSHYWQQHYRAAGKIRRVGSRPGKWMAGNIIINAVVPLLFLYSEMSRDSSFAERAVGWLQQLHRESNAVTDPLLRLGLDQQTAFDSQAVLELKTQYCDARKCLECAIGYSLLNPRNNA
ncbi:MAG: DUF2851 family protein [Chitinophagaceae bacterium]|nr:MAG: DUF2851 family protein [Chitinophagaceae bacterium]